MKAGNGLAADLHEFQITPAGTALLTAYYPIHCDLVADRRPQQTRGHRLAAPGDRHRDRPRDVPVDLGRPRRADATPTRRSAGSSASWPFDFFHLNSINLDADGSLLISSRNTWAADDIDAATGQIRWTLGGKHSSFTEGPGATTAFQHDARPIGSRRDLAVRQRRVPAGAPPVARRRARDRPGDRSVVSVRQQFLHPGDRLLAESQGNLQALPDGNWFVGWGQEPDLSEFSATGALLFDASFPSGYESYRALSLPLATPPRRAAGARGRARGAAAPTSAGTGRRASRAGSFARAAPPTGLRHVGSVGSAGFETTIPLASRRDPNATSQVRALDADGHVLATSALARIRRPSRR